MPSRACAQVPVESPRPAPAAAARLYALVHKLIQPLAPPPAFRPPARSSWRTAPMRTSDHRAWWGPGAAGGHGRACGRARWPGFSWAVTPGRPRCRWRVGCVWRGRWCTPARTHTHSQYRHEIWCELRARVPEHHRDRTKWARDRPLACWWSVWSHLNHFSKAWQPTHLHHYCARC